MKVIITGSSGFIGQHLSNLLNKENWQVEGLQLRPETVDEMLIQQPLQADALVHLAGIAHDLKGENKVEIYQQVNTELSIKLIECFLQSECKDFVYISSIKAQADSSALALDESMPSAPTMPYGISKFKVEKYIQSLDIPKGKRIFILRPAMVYGAHCKGNMPVLYKMLRRGIPYPFAAFDNKRSFLNVNNLIFVIGQLLDKQHIESDTFNIADDEVLSSTDLVSNIGLAGNFRPSILKVPKAMIKVIAKIGDVFRLPITSHRLLKLTESYAVSNKKIKQSLQINSMPFSLLEGLKDMVESMPKNK